MAVQIVGSIGRLRRMLHAPRHHNIAEISPYPLLRLRKLDTKRGRVKADQRRKLAPTVKIPLFTT
jgi:hypothetical protein